MKISLSDLEEARRNPEEYLKKQQSSTGIKYNPKSKHRMLIRSIYTFHRKGSDPNSAQNYLEASFAKNFKDQRQLPLYIEQLGQYILSFKDSNAMVFKVRDILTIPLSAEFNDANFRISGEIPRIDITPDGYTAWIFSNKPVDWENEIRLPLIQSAYAEILKVDQQEIKVNIYDFIKGDCKSFQFSKSELENANKDFIKTLKQIRLLENRNF